MSRYIDADALKRKAQKVGTEAWKMKMTAPIETTLNQFIDWIDNAPSIDIEPKRGEWIPCTKSGLALTELMRREGQKWYGYRCSNCNHIYKGNALTDCNFCPNCGAKMGEREGE